jgi:hypothetical protein
MTPLLPPPIVEDIDDIDLFRLASPPLNLSDTALLYKYPNRRIPIYSEIEDRLLNLDTFKIDDD